ncbi:MAG TPA: protein translocase subunit SecD [Gemmatimonadaceae bacterium]|jgi:preprotein translocase subunit SecD|nr:protein translocase subunit SecD [Gemmatimonadaceae bacterium]
MNLKWRIAIILGLTAASIWALFPRTVVERVKRNGEFVYDTVRRVPLKRGLDLQGGMHLALDVDESKGAVADKSKAIDNALKVVRNRIDEFGVSEPVVQKAGNDRIIVELPGIDDPQRAQDVVQKSAFLEFQITDETQALEKALPRINALVKDARVNVATNAPATTKDTATQGLQSLFTTDTSKKADSTKADTTAVVGGTVGGPGAFSKLVQPGQMPGEYMVAQSDVDLVTQYLSMPAVQAALPPGKVVRWSSDTLSFGGRVYRPLYVLDAKPIITGQYLTDAKPNTSPTEGNLVEFTMNNEGARRFRTETGRHIKDYMAIVLDQRVMGRPPIIQSAIGAHGQITMGGKDLQAAQDLALVLRAGSLPVPLKVADVTQIGASLGKDSIHKGITAGIIAVVLVVVVMLGYYRFSGALAVAALSLYILYTLAALAGFSAVLTLPGLAGFVLSIGIAVDANVLIFERIREELSHGKTVRTAIDEGFRHAMSAIVDSNVSTALTAAVLYQYGTGPVRGFAVTLLAGIAASMITSIFVVRTFYMIWLNRSRAAQTSLSI